MRFSSRLSRYTRAADWSDKGVTQTINSWSEVYTVKPAVWKAAGMEPMDGCLCIGCLEQRLGRTLTARDFPFLILSIQSTARNDYYRGVGSRQQ